MFQSYNHLYFKLVCAFSAVFLCINLVSTYLIAEINTKFFGDYISQIKPFCTKKNMILKEIKLIEYNKKTGKSRVYCLYSNSFQNRELFINRVNNTKTLNLSRDVKLNEKEGIIWPFYR
jgi:hypothetical protein